MLRGMKIIFGFVVILSFFGCMGKHEQSRIADNLIESEEEKISILINNLNDDSINTRRKAIKGLSLIGTPAAIEQITYHAHRTWFDEASSKEALS